jgi:hypothetical protein
LLSDVVEVKCSRQESWIRHASTTVAGHVFVFEAAPEATSGWRVAAGVCPFSTFLYSGSRSFEAMR